MQFNKHSIDHPIYIKSYDANQRTAEVLQFNIINTDTNETKLEKIILSENVVITFDNIIPNWSPSMPDDIKTDDMKDLIKLNPEILIFGLGEELKQLDHSVLKPLYTNQIPFEIMTTANACRTYNLLAGEHRKVVVALIL